MTNINDLPTVYNPQETEDKIYKFWEENDCFKADETSDKPPYSIVIPPPNVTGVLHIGHALDNTLQDILIRYHRMSGYEALWVPGTDHAGIATQNVVEKKLREQGKTRHDLGRETNDIEFPKDVLLQFRIPFRCQKLHFGNEDTSLRCMHLCKSNLFHKV